jgi:hypothetical protein
MDDYFSSKNNDINIRGSIDRPGHWMGDDCDASGVE